MAARQTDCNIIKNTIIALGVILILIIVFSLFTGFLKMQ